MDTCKSMFVILLIILILFTGCTPQEAPVTETPEAVNEEPAEALEEVVEEIVEATKWRGAFLVSPLDLQATDEDDFGVAVDSTFTLKGLETVTNISENITFEPAIEFEAVMPGNFEARIMPQAPLAAGQVYKVTYASEEGSQTWAFQTQEDFRLKRSIPSHQASGVPVDAVVEWVFTRENLVNINRFVTIEPEVAGQWRFDSGVWTFLPEKLEPNTMYTFTLSGDYMTDDGETLGQPVVKAFVTAEAETGRPDTWISFETMYHEKPDQSWLIRINGRGFDPGETFPVRIESYEDLNDFTDDVLAQSQQTWMPWFVTPSRGWVPDENLTLVEETLGTVVGSTSYRGSEFYLSVPDNLPEGNYRLSVDVDGITSKTLVQAHAMNAMIETTDRELVFWAVDPETGAGVKDLIVSAEDEIRRTDEEGLAIFRMELAEDPMVVLAKEEGRQPLVLALPRNWHYGDYSLWSGYYRNPDYYATIFTDRGLYQPTDTIEGWGLLQAKEEAGAKALKVTLESFGETPSILAETEADLDETGTFVFDFEIKDLLPQAYRIRVFDGETLVMSQSVDVGKYVKPELVVELESDKLYYESGEEMELAISCNFFDGTPSSGTELEVTYHDNAYHRETVKTDKNGKAKLKVPLNYEATTIHGQSVYVNVRTKDEQNREVGDYVNVMVFPRDVWVQVDAEAEDDTAHVTISNYALDLDKANGSQGTGQVSDYWGDPVALDLQIEVVEVYWEQTSTQKTYDPIERRMIEEPHYSKRENTVTRFSFKGVEGGSFEFAVETGKYYKVVVLTKDQQERTVSVDQSVRNYWGQPDPNSLYIDLRKPDWDLEYGIGDTVSLTLTRGDMPVEDFAENAKFLAVIYHNGLREVRSFTTPVVEFDFKESDLPNLYVQALYYDGKQFLRSMATNVSFRESDRGLQIDLETNKERYEPGDTVTVDFAVTDRDGNPVSANLYLAVVDEAFFAVRGQTADILRDLYRNIGYPMLGRSIATTDGGFYSLMGGAEGGGEGESIAIRSDFRDTATVQDLKTNAEGKAQFAFVVPDNLTSWRLTALGVTEDLLAGDQIGNVQVGLPFFLQVIGGEEYLNGDMPAIGYRVYGAKDGTEVTHRLALKQGQETLYETELEADAGELSYLYLPELKTGTYDLTMTSQTADATDGIEKTIQVVDARNAAWLDFEYQPGDLFLYPYGELTIVPGQQGWLYREWRQLAYTWSQRTDAIQAERIAQKEVNQWLQEKMDIAEPPFEYQQYNGGFGLVAYGESDPIMTAKMVASGLPVSMENKALMYLNRFMESAKEETELAAALWGLASQGEPVLTDLLAAKKTMVEDQARLYLALGFAELGATNEAISIYEPMMRQRAYAYGDMTYLKAENFDEERIDTMLAALVAVRLDRPEAVELYRYMKNRPPLNELNNLERALFLMEIPVDVSVQGQVKAILPDRTIDQTIGVEDAVRTLISAEDLAKAEWRTVENVEMTLSAYVPVGQLFDPEKGLLGLQRQYLPADKTLEQLQVGDEVQVHFALQLDRNAPKGGYVITDALPSNLRYMEKTKRSGDEYWISHNGQQVTIYTWPKGKALGVTVLARVVAPGEYVAEPAFVQARQGYGDLNTSLFGFSEAQTLVVNEDETAAVE